MRRIIVCIAFCIPLVVAAQSLSIQELWQQLEQSSGQQQRDSEIALRMAELEVTRQGRMPVIYGDVNLQRNLIIPTTPVPAIAFDPDAAEGAIIPLKFSTKWSAKAGLQAEWKIFDPKQRLDEEERALQVEKAAIEKEHDAQEWKRDATLAYASVVLASQQYERAQQDSALYAEVVALVSARYEAGRETSASYFEAQQEMERKRIQLYESWSVLLEADLELRKYADLGATTSLSTDIPAIHEWVENHATQSYAIQSLQKDRQIAQLQLRRIQRERLPTVSLNAYLGEQYYSNEFRLDRGDEWFGNSFVNIGLRIPISTYFTSKSSVRQAQLNSSLFDLQIAEEEKLEAISDRQQVLKISTAKKKLQRLERIEKLALQNMQIQRQAYEAGRLLLSDYNGSLLSYHQATRDVWQAQYDLTTLLME